MPTRDPQTTPFVRRRPLSVRYVICPLVRRPLVYRFFRPAFHFLFSFFRCVAPRRRLCAMRSLAHTGSQYRSDNPSPYPTDGLIIPVPIFLSPNPSGYPTSASVRVARQIARLPTLLPFAHCLLATASGLLLFASTTRNSPAIAHWLGSDGWIDGWKTGWKTGAVLES